MEHLLNAWSLLDSVDHRSHIVVVPAYTPENSAPIVFALNDVWVGPQ